MRVYEIAKELGVNSKDLLLFLKNNGRAVASHMSILSDEALIAIKKKYTPVVSQSSEKVSKKSAKNEKKESVAKPIEQPVAHKHKFNAFDHDVQKKEKSGLGESAPVIGVDKQPAVKISTSDSLSSGLLGKGAAFDAEVFREAPEIIAEELNLSALSRGREKIDRFLVKRGSDAGGARSFRRRSRRRRTKFIDEVAPKIIDHILIDRAMPLFEVADLMGKTASELIAPLLKKGMVCNRNYVLMPDIIKSLADGFGIKFSVGSLSGQNEPVALRGAGKVQGAAHWVQRWPIVVVMGHVDHGKTTLLDYIRKMKVAASEKGGITQHLGAYEVESTHGKIVFLDTPGHEAFTCIRERGSRITDIVVLVVAADDGIKPQTIEAINHAKAAGVPIIVAINKIDKVQSPAAIETVKRQLAQHELMPEDWGGQTIIAPISAKTGQGVDNLLELIVLQSHLMELKADATASAKAFVLESKVERGYGPVATVICMEGTLKQGDYFTCGGSTGKIRLLIDSNGKKNQKIEPSVPAQVVGFDSTTAIGDWLNVVSRETYAKAKANKQVESPIPTEGGSAQVVLHGDTDKKKSLNLIIKTDTRGSKDALMNCIEKLSKLSKTVKCPIYVVSSGVGDISESDIEFAENTGSMIIGLHVKQEKNAISLAKQKKVTVLLYDIIYRLVEELEVLLQSKKEAEIIWNKVGEAVVKKVFDIKGVGVIAGCFMRDGILARDYKVVCMRHDKKIGEGRVASLQRDKKLVKEIHAGFECGFVCDGFNEWAEGDVVLCYVRAKEKQK
jgi:translation initiation factor IF-2